MMVAKRIIPCLDIKDGQVVKGVKFENLKQAGNPGELAAQYDREGADELVFLDITASREKRETMRCVVEKTAQKVFIPFTVGGGIRNVEDIRTVLNAGADKVSINTAAVQNPDLINQGRDLYGSQCIVVAVDTKDTSNGHTVFIKGGMEDTGIPLLEWVKEAKDRGAGEILLTSIDHDGEKMGYAHDLTRKVVEATNLPVIASGGAGKLEDFYLLFSRGQASGALAASIFHFGELTIQEVKQYLHEKGVDVRL